MIMFNNTLVCPAATGFLSSSFPQSFTCSFCSPFSAKGETTRLTGRLQTLDCAEGRRIEKVPTTRSKNSRERNWLWQQHHKSSSITVNILFTFVVYLNNAPSHLFLASNSPTQLAHPLSPPPHPLTVRPLTRSRMEIEHWHSSIVEPDNN